MSQSLGLESGIVFWYVLRKSSPLIPLCSPKSLDPFKVRLPHWQQMKQKPNSLSLHNPVSSLQLIQPDQYKKEGVTWGIYYGIT